jgi:cyanate permease
MNQAAESLSPRWGAVVTYLFCGYVISLQFGRVAASLPELQSAFGLSLAQMGWMTSLVSLTAAVCGFAVATFGLWVGGRRCAFAGLALCWLGVCLGLFASSVATLFLGRTVEGIGFIFAACGLPSLLARAAGPRAAPFAMGLWATYLPLGMAMMLIATPSLSSLGGWRAAALANIFAVSAALLLFFFVAGLRSNDAATQRRQALAAAGQARRKGGVALGLIFCCYAAQFLAVTSFLPSVLRNPDFILRDWAGHITAAIVACNALGNVAGASALRRGVSMRGLLIGALMGMAVCGALALTTTGMKQPLWAAAMSFIGGVAPAVLFAAVNRLDLDQLAKSAAVGLLLQGVGIGQLFGPPLFGLVASFAGWGSTSALIVVFSLLGSAIALRAPLG